MFKLIRKNKELAKGVFLYISFSVFGPLLVIGGIGYFLDVYFKTKPFILLASVVVAYAFSNILIYKKTKEFNLSLQKIEQEIEDEKKDKDEDEKKESGHHEDDK